MTRRWIVATIVVGVVLAQPSAARAEVRLSIADGHVTLDASNATVRQILDEWARVGQTKFVNVERLTGAPLTLQLTHVPEARALDILLRAVSGYLLAPRPVAVANASQFDRILVMPTSTPPRASTTPAASAQPAFQPPQFPGGVPPPDMDDDTIPGAPGVNPNPRGGSGLPQFPGGSPAFPGSSPPFPGAVQGPGGVVPQRGPAFPTQASPFPAPSGSPQVPIPPAGAFPPPSGVFPPGGGVFPPASGGFPGAPAGTMPVGVAVPGMVLQPPLQPTPPSQLEPQ